MQMKRPSHRSVITILLVLACPWLTMLLMVYTAKRLIPPRAVVLPDFPYGLSRADDSTQRFKQVACLHELTPC